MKKLTGAFAKLRKPPSTVMTNRRSGASLHTMADDRRYRRMTRRSAGDTDVRVSAGMVRTEAEATAVIGMAETAFEAFRAAGCSTTQALVALAALSADDVVRAVGALSARVAELEARPTMKYAGVWRAGEQYEPGSFVTHAGSVWHAEIISRGVRPGEGTAAWRLAVKSPRPPRTDAGGSRT